MSIRDQRAALAQALAAAGVSGVYTDPPSTVSPPCVIVAPDEPYLEPLSIGPSGEATVAVRFVLVCAVAHRDPAGALDQLEQLVVDVWHAVPQGTEIGDAGRPQLETVGPSELLTTAVPVLLRATV